MTQDEDDAPTPPTGPDACQLVQGGDSHVGGQGVAYAMGISAGAPAPAEPVAR